MDRGYEIFCLADAHFYDSPLRGRSHDPDWPLAQQAAPQGWTRSELGDWLVYWPPNVQLPAQGWKVHSSACLDNAERVLDVVYRFCVAREIPFKFVRSRQLLALRNLKYADRGSSGKFVTIYPGDEPQLEAILHELGALLEGEPGPYILSDLRWGAGPLHVRYGGFAERYCVDESGELELAIVDPEGNLVPDRRDPVFSPPSWVTLPDCLAPHLEARNRTTVADLPYRIEEALHFSNGGGVYAGVDERTGERVVLKEARPYAGLDARGADAIARLERERSVLERLAGLDAVPALRDSFALGEHRFVVEEFVEGVPLRKALVGRYPLVVSGFSTRDLEDYTAWALDVVEALERAVAAIHERGVVVGDLHPWNVLVRPDGRPALVDFECAAPAEAGWRPALGAPGFVAPRDRTGFDVDRYALACVRLFVFLPLTTLLFVDRSKAAHLAEVVGEVFPVPAPFLDEAVHVILGEQRAAAPGPFPRIEPDAEGWRRARESMAQAILASATPERDDRLFPGDVAQFASGGGLNLAHGAAGVLYALAATGCGRFPEHEDWLIRHALDPESGATSGLYDGLAGVAYVLDRLGRRAEALKVLDICLDGLRGSWDRLPLDLFAGLAGIALTLGHFARVTQDPALDGLTLEVAGVVANRLGSEDALPAVSGGAHPYAGLTRGSSGPALLFLRLFELRRDERLLDLAATALRQDLRRCMLRDDGSLEVNEGWRTMPYLADGSVGIGMVLEDYLGHRPDEQFVGALEGIRRAAEGEFYVEPGLLQGRAGMILHLCRAYAPGTAAAADPVVARHIRRLAWHALQFQGRLAFPGEELLRLSMDLATGTAGVLLAIGAALHDEPVHLPFLGADAAVRT